MSDSELVTYRCPRCGDSVETLPGWTVEHRCPQNRNRTTRYQPQEDTAE